MCLDGDRLVIDCEVGRKSESGAPTLGLRTLPTRPLPLLLAGLAEPPGRTTLT